MGCWFSKRFLTNSVIFSLCQCTERDVEKHEHNEKMTELVKNHLENQHINYFIQMDTKRVITYSNMLGEMTRNSNNGKTSSSKPSPNKDSKNDWYTMYKNLVPERPLLNK